MSEGPIQAQSQSLVSFLIFLRSTLKLVDPPATMDLQQKQACWKLELEVIDNDSSWVCFSFSTSYITVSSGSVLLKLMLM